MLGSEDRRICHGTNAILLSIVPHQGRNDNRRTGGPIRANLKALRPNQMVVLLRAVVFSSQIIWHEAYSARQIPVHWLQSLQVQDTIRIRVIILDL